jgi:monoamine oxidase
VLQKFFGERLLVGEHTRTDFFGYMEGALRSGRRAATAVIFKVCPGSLPDFPNA